MFVPDYIVKGCKCERLSSEFGDKSAVCVLLHKGSYIIKLTSDSRLNLPHSRHAYDDETLVTAFSV